ncbi:RNA polymerase sigma factor [Paenibacillus sp. N4]|uniref:RNA polymerase sigma factor n=1 Tax=Paenibacillus vietnamensis TaxID=2590547 RepID=UPI001CD1373C|nr:RNA polymerase sigma factor [Paenibacillus vietnamensis]MCA0754316.1 RNA polymerase sigma factor [Paenibacillus vietnamensis]
MRAVISAQKEESAALARLHAAVFRYCLSITGSRWDAEDLAQDAWLKAVTLAKAAGCGHGNMEALLMRIAKTTWIDRTRRRKRYERIVRLEQVPEPSSGPNAAQLEEMFHALLHHLSPLQRSVFLLRDVYGFSTADVSELLAVTQGAVKAALHRARAALSSVRAELEQPALEQPEDEQTKLWLRAIAAAYEKGDAVQLLRLVQSDTAEAACAAGLLHNIVYGKRRLASRRGPALQMAA